MKSIPQKKVRFQERIRASIQEDENGCWIWQKSKSWNGYGAFALGGGNNDRAHRISYLVFIGELLPGMDVCHKCDVRSCVNPNHLFLGTRSDNLMDASQKNRMSRTHQKKGSKHPSAKLLECNVVTILRMLKEGKTKHSIAKKFCVSDRIILLIYRNELWRHVARPA